MRVKLLALALTAIAAPMASAVIIEDFEHNNMGLYSAATGGTVNMSITGAAAHDGQLGGRFTGSGTPFMLRASAPTSANSVTTAFVRAAGGATGRLYIGVGASGAGAYSMVIGNNTNTILVQNNTAWGFTDMASAAFTPVAGTWYQLRLSWASNGDMQTSVYNEAGTSLLAQTGIAATGFTTSGGLSLRGFNGWDVDTISTNAIPEPATMLALGAGVAAFLRRRKK